MHVILPNREEKKVADHKKCKNVKGGKMLEENNLVIITFFHCI